MPTTTIRSPPSEADFTPLAEYESQTPDTFFDGNPVLHFKAAGAKCWISKSQLGSLPVFPADATSTPSGPEAPSAGSSEELIEQKLDVWVNSANLTLFNHEAQVGVTISYPTISIHALKTIGEGPSQVQGIWMQMELGDADDDGSETTELTLIPAAPADEEDSASVTKHLFEAISACSNLHPDPVDEEDDDDDDDRIVFEGNPEFEALEGFSGVMRGAGDGGLPPPMPGSSGWITAENVHEYFDEEGNWIGNAEGEGEGEGEELGDGAGRVRNREETEKVNGEKDEDSESKRPRVE
ncbi:uncharacterized protein DNG_03489 [Cephalotrichum gorgonifer]|uniref:Uncharacterized protein n=1 Tax=Cephalotrichum gorgonifer TaxID=2041049 RepID=A0AAE8MWM0_9PEZI|nr:uncharacterized protein DNG_03489 [Cephalotrichum gorgonifer]